MAKVYDGVNGIRVPQHSDFRSGDFKTDWEAYEKAEDEYVEKIKEFAKKNGKGPLRGEEVSFGHADGAARYIVLTGTKLIHLAVGDAWGAPIAHYITAKGIKEEIERDRAIAEMYRKRRLS